MAERTPSRKGSRKSVGQTKSPQQSTATNEKSKAQPAIDYPTGGWEPTLTDWRVAVPNSLISIVFSTIICWLIVSYIELPPEQRSVPAHRDFYHPQIAMGLIAYYLILCISRWIESDSHVLYEMLWGCNMAMLFTIIGLLINSPLLAGIGAALVTIDQMCWYVDCLGFLFTGCKKFPIGVAAYLIWPSTATMKKVTAFHHLWFLPLLLYVLNYQYPDYSFFLSAVMSAVLGFFGRFFTPFHCLLPKPVNASTDEPHKVLYLNINFGYAFWKDIKLKFMHVLDHRHPVIYLPFVVVVANTVLNYPAFLLLKLLLAGLASLGVITPISA